MIRSDSSSEQVIAKISFVSLWKRSPKWVAITLHEEFLICPYLARQLSEF
jgi:hypothetical protein